MSLDFRSAGSTTFKREVLERGFEPDSCFYIQSVERIQNKRRIDIEIDPPPDLIIEVDLTNDSLDKFDLYAAFHVPEIWRYEDKLEIWLLEEGHYTQYSKGVVFTFLTDKILSELVEARFSMKRPAWLRQVRTQIQSLLP
jgi:Uma2 family endonuclease